ncbi:unnamed protein product [Plutella xylostella]|uniref:(diamondback moth) hypothetical protein n=1 Tax=Plutella xylostella TaxID=51655 RepID=A0A8S4FXS0_PLUXY|nr:unnamed protein product [Plutella xylostella]
MAKEKQTLMCRSWSEFWVNLDAPKRQVRFPRGPGQRAGTGHPAYRLDLTTTGACRLPHY